jgi:integrase
LAEGLSPTEAAKRYLRIEHAAQLLRTHREVVELVRAVASRFSSRWRLIGLDVPADAPAAQHALPPLQDWAESMGYDGWTENELQEMYAKHFAEQLARPADPAAKSAARRNARNARFRKERRELLDQLQAAVVEKATRHDPLAGWFAPDVAQKLRAIGALTLGDLQARLRRGGQWWRGLKGIGAGKAEVIASHVDQLLEHAPMPTSMVPACVPIARIGSAGVPQASGIGGRNRAPVGPYRVVDADTDEAAIEVWISARCNSPKTRASYRRELTRFRLWLWSTRQLALSDAAVDDCLAYMDFLANVPDSWMSSRKAAPGQAGWAPFRTQPTVASQQLALNIIHSAFGWLKENGYLQLNPWNAINRSLGDEDPETAEERGAMVDDDDPTSRAFTPQAWRALVDQAEADAQAWRTAAGARRMQWLLQFCEATGLRADELLRARRRSLFCKDDSWHMRIYGKGKRKRRIPVPRRVIELTRIYFKSRGLDFDSCPPRTHLLGATATARVKTSDMPPAEAKPTETGITYPALAQSFKALVHRAARRLPADEAAVMRKASLHWLRHTHGTRSAERGMSATDIQTNLGHVDLRTATGYTRAQLRRRAELVEKAFG